MGWRSDWGEEFLMQRRRDAGEEGRRIFNAEARGRYLFFQRRGVKAHWGRGIFEVWGLSFSSLRPLRLCARYLKILTQGRRGAGGEEFLGLGSFPYSLATFATWREIFKDFNAGARREKKSIPALIIMKESVSHSCSKTCRPFYAFCFSLCLDYQ